MAPARRPAHTGAEPDPVPPSPDRLGPPLGRVRVSLNTGLVTMSFVSVTRLRLRSFRFLPAFALHNLRTLAQVKAAPGFRGGSLLADRGLAFWTLTSWGGQGDMRAYMATGSHRAAMPHLLVWCDEASVVHWHQEEGMLPSWVEADRRMRGEGRPSKLRHPGPDHAALGFPPARTTVTGPLRPKRTL